jgi:hypothetical protein
MNIFKKFEKTKHLPPGHVDKINLEKAITKEYSLCGEIERKWAKRFKYKFESGSHALEFCNQICKTLGERSVLKLVLSSPDVKEYASAHYTNREIHFKSDWISLTTLIHELTHHFGDYTHGESFCQLENFLFSVAYTMVTGKQPKKDWV